MPKANLLLRVCIGISLSTAAVVRGAAELVVTRDAPVGSDGLSLINADVLVDPAAAPVVHEAADLLASDLKDVTGHAPTTQPVAGHAAIMIGTIGDGGPVDQLVGAGKVDATGVRGQWETFAWQLVDAPMNGVPRALVIVGSDRRGTAYGCTELSRAIGVSPWAWWADVPVAKHEQLAVSAGRKVDGPPGVKYRGIFINDEDFGLRQWASKNFDPPRTEIGPKTYNRIFELMLRLRLNYLWPAMHPGSGEFGSIPGNAEAADHWAIVMGASHCEPMLRNNVYWPHENGPWQYDINRDNILRYWTESAEQRGNYEAVWTMGIRGIHDTPMQGPPGVPARVKMMEGILADQEKLLGEKVGDRFGEPARCFVPYKEVLPLYDAGLTVPEEATLVWPDDNFGYIRHLPNDAERKRSGGNGVYYHVSYWGSPHSYLWVESNSPGLMWEELHKAYENDASRIWVVNVGDIKPAEVAIDFYSQLAWNPNRFGPDAQDKFLRAFLTETFGETAAGPLFDLQSKYYRVASRRKPEHFLWEHEKNRVEWLDGLSNATLDDVSNGYDELLALEQRASAAVPADRSDSYFEMIGYASRALALSGRLYVDLARAHRGQDAESLREQANGAMRQIRSDADRYNNQVAGGKWRGMMSLTEEGLDWSKEVGGTHEVAPMPAKIDPDPSVVLFDAADYSATKSSGGATWQPVAGVGRSGRSMTILPAKTFDGDGPSLTYDFELPANAKDSIVRLDLLPTMRIDPAGHLRISVSLDDAPATNYPVPGGESSDENSGPRRDGVISNRVTIELPRPNLSAGKHTLRVTAIDPGVVLDQIELPIGAKLLSQR